MLSSAISPGPYQAVKLENLSKINSPESVLRVFLVTGGVAPTEVIPHEILSHLYAFTLELNLIVAVCPVERKKIIEFSKKRPQYQPLCINVKKESPFNAKIQAHGFFPNKKFEKKICIYEYSTELQKLMNLVDFSGIKCRVSIDCTKKLSSALIL